MGTWTFTTTGYAALPAQAPANWPSYVTYPGAADASVNNTHTFTMNDADFLRLLTWVATSQFQATGGGQGGGPITPAAPTVSQMCRSLELGPWWGGVKQAEQQLSTVPAAMPPPITVT